MGVSPEVTEEKMSSNSNSSSSNWESSGNLSRHVSTSQLETFRVTRSVSSVSPMTTFGHLPIDSEPIRILDDPNPYKVSRIDELRIQVQNPFRGRTKSAVHLNSPVPSNRSSSVHYYQELDDFESHSDDLIDDEDSITRKLANLPKFFKRASRTSSGGYEIPDAEGSSGSSEDFPLPPSDASDEYSHSLSSDGMSPSPIQSQSPSPPKISERERTRIQHALTGRKTKIFVSDSLANLYYKAKHPRPPSSISSVTTGSNSTQAQQESVEWILKYTGVPVLLFDTGETKSRDKRKIQIILAELGSGLALWKDTIDNLSSYRVIGKESSTNGNEGSSFHTMHLSADHTKVVGISFDNEESAAVFGQEVEKLTADFANISLSGSKFQKKIKNGDKKKKEIKWVRPRKNEISQPCAFQHVSSVSQKDTSLFSSLQNFVSGKTTTNPQLNRVDDLS